jgi:hypothetical protein
MSGVDRILPLGVVRGALQRVAVVQQRRAGRGRQVVGCRGRDDTGIDRRGVGVRRGCALPGGQRLGARPGRVADGEAKVVVTNAVGGLGKIVGEAAERPRSARRQARSDPPQAGADKARSVGPPPTPLSFVPFAVGDAKQLSRCPLSRREDLEASLGGRNGRNGTKLEETTKRKKREIL